MDYAVLGIPQARILEWIAIPSSRGSSQLRDWTQVSHIAGRFFTSWAIKEALWGEREEKKGIERKEKGRGREREAERVYSLILNNDYV